MFGRGFCMYCCLHCVCVYMSKKFKKLLNIYIHKFICSTYAFSIHKAYLTNNYQCTSFAFYANTPHSLPLLLLVVCTLLFLITGDATVIWKQGDRVIFADKIHVSTEMRASIVDRTSLLLRGVDTQYTGKNPIVLKLAFLKNIA